MTHPDDMTNPDDMTHPEDQFSYDTIADAYAAGVDTAPYNALYERPAMLALLPSLAGARVLDAGCGAGWYAEQLLGRGATVVSVDASAVMVEHARRRLEPLGVLGTGGRGELRVADLAHPLAFAGDASFDGIVSPLVLHYLRDWGPTLAEFRRVLRPNGWLVFSTHHPTTEAERLGVARYRDVELVDEVWHWVGRVRFYRRPLSAIVDALSGAGFLVERLEEPLPTPAFRDAKPEAYARILRRPEFLLIRARPLG
ncbi:MAG TPA: class I SAM-dependent methyltransferase [Gemmatimonadaceae bacterium]|nr:class I SAM-dependent methyltransferase [Gemmatimonadaceae bacterium]